MKVKIDTKEKFHAITVSEASISATMTEELYTCLLQNLQNDVKNVVLILKDTETIDDAAAKAIVNIQQKFYASKASFVVCELRKPVIEFLNISGWSEAMNIAPTESEAADIVQMEELERELLAEDENF